MGVLHKETMDRGANEGGFLHLSPVEEKAAGLPFVVLACARESYAIEIAVVREIIRVPRITWIPGARPPVRGLINLRGSIVAVLDLAELLTGRHSEPEEDSRIVIVESGAATVGLLVDAASSVAEIPASELKLPLATLDETLRRFIVGQAGVGTQIVGLLDVDGLVRHARELQEQS